MTEKTGLKERFLSDDVPIRLGNLASNLKRIKAFATNPALSEAADQVVRESTYFIEWTALDLDTERCAELVELQVQLASWHLNWASLWEDPAQRATMAAQADAWSGRVLHMSGLLQRQESA